MQSRSIVKGAPIHWGVVERSLRTLSRTIVNRALTHISRNMYAETSQMLVFLRQIAHDPLLCGPLTYFTPKTNDKENDMLPLFVWLNDRAGRRTGSNIVSSRGPPNAMCPRPRIPPHHLTWYRKRLLWHPPRAVQLATPEGESHKVHISTGDVESHTTYHIRHHLKPG